MADKKNIEISSDLYDAIQQLKSIFSEMSGKPIEKDEDVLSILVSGFIDSVMQEQEGGNGEDDEEGEDDDDESESGHHHKHGCACGGNCNCDKESCGCGHGH